MSPRSTRRQLITVRTATLDDIPAIQRCRTGHPPDAVAAVFTKMLEAAGPRRWWTGVAERGGDVVGTVALIRHGSHLLGDGTVWIPHYGDDVAAIEDLVVREDARGEGAGTALVRAAIAQAADWQLRQVRAYTSNPIAARALERAGMRCWGEVPAAREPGGVERHYVL